jgi:aminoglycoside phosphotransferase (APT) family kinase protein
MIMYGNIISSRDGATVAMGELDGSKVAVKTFTAERAFKREIGALEVLNRTGAPVPLMIWFGVDRGKFTIVQEWVEGELGLDAFRASSENGRMLMARTAGSTLGLFGNATRGIGEKDASFMQYVKNTDGSHLDWPSLLGSQLRKWRSKLTPQTVSQLGGESAIDALERRSMAAYNGPSSLIHCDYILRNVIFGRSGEATIIDLGTAMVGDPQYDLGKIVWRDFPGLNSQASSAFITAWSQSSGIPVLPGRLAMYVACHCLAALAWVDKQRALTETDKDFRRLALSGFAQASVELS